MTDLPANVYRLPQRRFDAIPGAPWVYWLSNSTLEAFEDCFRRPMPLLWKRGITTSENHRFVRFWWEVKHNSISFGCQSMAEALQTNKRWFPYMKGGSPRTWYGNLDCVLNWADKGAELLSFPAAAVRNRSSQLMEGVTYSSVSAASFSARLMPHGFLFDQASNALFPVNITPTMLLGVLNSQPARFFLGLNPTVNIVEADFHRVPFPTGDSSAIDSLVGIACRKRLKDVTSSEATFDFISPLGWNTGLDDVISTYIDMIDLEDRINYEVYRLYGISDADRAAIEGELAGGVLEHRDGEGDEDTKPEEREEETTAGAMTREELAVRWISYAVGVVLGRFRPGVVGALGRATYRRDDFAIGSLPAPDEAEFDELVGPVERFAYVDATGGRHVFPAEVEQALSDLALIDGIAVLDEGHPRDLPVLVEKALRLMLDPPKLPMVNRQLSMVNPADEVVAAGANGDLRKFLEKDFFTKWHLKWYRKRPVYWPLQSARRGYGFVLFHEKVEKYTLYVLLRDYLDHKLNGLRLQIEDLLALAAGQTGAARRQTERQLDRARQLLDEVNVFAQTIDRTAKGGYQPEANWIDDGVILRLAPLWELIPIWKAEPKKYWERLEGGDHDWSHIAMAYWPARVRAACRTNKSFAIAHGHEEWSGGGMS